MMGDPPLSTVHLQVIYSFSSPFSSLPRRRRRSQLSAPAHHSSTHAPSHSGNHSLTPSTAFARKTHLHNNISFNSSKGHLLRIRSSSIYTNYASNAYCSRQRLVGRRCCRSSAYTCRRRSSWVVLGLARPSVALWEEGRDTEGRRRPGKGWYLRADTW